jgi:hypothetical protein
MSHEPHVRSEEGGELGRGEKEFGLGLGRWIAQKLLSKRSYLDHARWA